MLERDVAGEYNTFQVYLLMLRLKNCGPREVAEALGFSSPSLAVHHLDKLCGLKLLSKDEYGVYHVVPKRFGVLKFFFVIRQFIVPRSFFYAVFYGVAAVFSLFLLSGMVRNVALLFSLAGLGIHVVETMEFYKVLPKSNRSRS